MNARISKTEHTLLFTCLILIYIYLRDVNGRLGGSNLWSIVSVITWQANLKHVRTECVAMRDYAPQYCTQSVREQNSHVGHDGAVGRLQLVTVLP